MLKISGVSNTRYLSLIIKACLNHAILSQNWKNANVVLIHKKNDKQSIKNYRPVSHLLIYG